MSVVDRVAATERYAAATARPLAVAGRSAIGLRNVAFTYPNGTEALAGVSLDIAQGSRIGIVGPSGCGKSTLLALLAGLERPTTGDVNMTFFDQRRHPLTMVFQKDTLLPWFTVEQNVRLHYRFKRAKSESAVDDLVTELIQLAGLEGFRCAYPHQLSGGMRRRVAFLTGVAPAPEILLLDEPFSSLDEPTRVAIHQDAYQILLKHKMTMVLITHDLAEAISLCEEVLLFTHRPGRVYSRHKIPFGAERDMLKLRQTPEFLSLYGELWRDLGVQIHASKADTGSGGAG